jgi:hypothetical protein
MRGPPLSPWQVSLPKYKKCAVKRCRIYNAEEAQRGYDFGGNLVLTEGLYDIYI